MGSLFEHEGSLYLVGIEAEYREIRKFLRGWRRGHHPQNLRAIRAPANFFFKDSIPPEFVSIFLYYKNDDKCYLFGQKAEKEAIKKVSSRELRHGNTVIKIAVRR